MDQKIFICYSRADGEFAVRLDHDLDSAGFDSFLDQNDIPAGARWDEFVEKALKESTTVVVILSPSSVSSENVGDEIAYALREGKRVIPVRHKVCQVPMRIDRLQHIDFTTSYEAGLGQLVTALKADAVKGTKRKRARAEVLPPEPDRPVEAVVAVVVPQQPDLALQPIVVGTPRNQRKLLPAIFAVLLLLGAGAVWVWRSVSDATAPEISSASTTFGFKSPTDTSNTTTTGTTSTTSTNDHRTATGTAGAAATDTTTTSGTSHTTTTSKAESTSRRPEAVAKPKPSPRPLQCVAEELDACCRDSAKPAECRKCKQQLDLPDRCE